MTPPAERGRGPARRSQPILAFALAAALAASAVPGAHSPAATASPSLPVPSAVSSIVPVGALDVPTTGWYSYRDQSSAGFAATYRARRGAYLPVDLDIDTSSDYRVGSVWQRNSANRGWRVRRNLTSAQYTAYWDDARADGFRLLEHETYVVGGSRRYAGIWVGNREGLAWASRRGQTSAQLTATTAEYRAAGLMPIDVDAYVVDGAMRWSTVWVAGQGRAWRLVRDRTSSQWSATFAELSDDHRVVAFDSTRSSGGQRYHGVFVTNEPGRGWAFRRDLSAAAYGNWWHRYRDLGYRVVGYNRYRTPAGTRYSATWRQNSDRPTWPQRASFDDTIAQRLEERGFPGVSVAVFDDGVPVYTRGFGDADRGDDVWMDATHTGNIASVSKAVAGVLTFRMIERGELELDDATRAWVPTMPAFQTHTVGQLLSNRGCVRHYATGLDGLEGDEFDTALAASAEIWDDDLVCDPVAAVEDNYSTHGYTFLGAALEAAGGDDIQALVSSRLTTPYGLGTLGPQRFSGHRMSVYDDEGDEIAVPVNDWKVLGGGLDSNAVDLASFGDRLAAGDILTAASLESMWTPPDTTSSYAHGWETGTTSGYDWVGKNGAGKGCGAYLLMYPDLGITVAVLANTNVPLPDPEAKFFSLRLARELGSMLLPTIG